MANFMMFAAEHGYEQINVDLIRRSLKTWTATSPCILMPPIRGCLMVRKPDSSGMTMSASGEKS